MMRKLLSFTLLILILGSCAAIARAEEHLTLSAQELTVGDRLLIQASDDAPRRTYALYLEGEQINTGASAEAKSAAFNPQTPGHYTLVVTPEGSAPETVEFNVYDQLSVSPSLNQTVVKAGEMISLNAQTLGGSPEKEYEFSVWQGTVRIAREKGAESVFEFVPFTEGDLLLSVSVTDSLGNTASAAADPVHVAGFAGVDVEGDLSAVLVQGEMRSLEVQSPGPWTARSDSDFITLMNNCGNAGDALTYTVSASTVGSRTGIITVSSLGMSRRITIRQTEENAEETEVLLFGEVSDWIEVDGHTALSWMVPAEGGVYTAQITAGGSWTAETEADYLHIQQEGDRLTVTVDGNTTTGFLNASIYLRSGEASAVIGVAQEAPAKGTAIREVLLNRDRGRAYQDQVRVRVLTDASADSVTLTIDQAAPISYSGMEYAKPYQDGLQWDFEVPLTGAGAQSWLFTAVNEDGSGKKALATLNVEGEAPAFVGLASGTINDSTVNVFTTRSAEEITALNEEGAVTATFSAANARIDRAMDESGRYARWTLPVSPENAAALRIGDQQVEVHWSLLINPAADQEENAVFHPYSQMDGTWRNKGYRKSNLEKSGCAIFALSHALQLLGHDEPASKPEQLAITYAFCLVDGGTLNSTLIGNAGKEFGYKTRFKLYTSKSDIVKKLSQGAMFSFGIVSGHIALIDRLSEDGTMCHIIDSAPSATFERITGETPYLYNEKSGQYVPLSSPAEIPGLLYYIDTEGYDGAQYWLPLDYVAERGVRLIQAN